MQIYKHWDTYLSIKFEGVTKSSSLDSTWSKWTKRCKYVAYKHLYDFLLEEEISFN